MRTRGIPEGMTMGAAGARNLITDVPGILVGQAEDPADYTGTTVVLAERPAVAVVDVRGGAPGTRETELLGSEALVDRVDAVVLLGGSAFGLDAAAGVMEWLAAARPWVCRRLAAGADRPRRDPLRPCLSRPEAVVRRAALPRPRPSRRRRGGGGFRARQRRRRSRRTRRPVEGRHRQRVLPSCRRRHPWRHRRRQQLGGRPCGRIAAAFGPPNWRSPVRSARNRRPRMQRSIRRIFRNATAMPSAATRRSPSSPPMPPSTRAAAGAWRSWRKAGSPAPSGRSTRRSTATACSRSHRRGPLGGAESLCGSVPPPPTASPAP